jgi:hypothetical protein
VPAEAAGIPVFGSIGAGAAGGRCLADEEGCGAPGLNWGSAAQGGGATRTSASLLGAGSDPPESKIRAAPAITASATTASTARLV